MARLFFPWLFNPNKPYSMSIMAALPIRHAFFSASLVLLSTGCGGDGPDPAVPQRPLPTYLGHETDLFDDGIEPRAVGLELEKPDNPLQDPKFRERVITSDAVLRARVATVTTREEDSGAAFQLSLRVTERLAGPHPPGDPFTLDVGRKSASLGVLKNFNARLVGMSFIVFVRRYVRPDGDSELHFHLTQDAPDVKKAAVETAAINSVR